MEPVCGVCYQPLGRSTAWWLVQGLERYWGLGRRICPGNPPVTGEGAALVLLGLLGLRTDLRNRAWIKSLLAKENRALGK